MRPLLPALAFGLAAAFSAAAQEAQPQPPSAAQRSLAAGYTAVTTCSAIHNARENGAERTLESVRANELVGVYPEVDSLVRELPVEVSDEGASVVWDAAMPPRIALYTPGAGCAVMPVGYAAGAERAPVQRHAPAAPLPSGALRGDVDALNGEVERAFDAGFGERTNTTAVVVVQDGRVVAERYAEGFGPDTPQRTWSVAKSLAGTLVGAAVQRGEADVSAPAAINDWHTPGDPRAAITLDNLLRMASGLTSDTAGNRTDALYFGGVAIEEQTPGWPLIAPPGSTFRYANNDILLAVLAIAPTFAEASPNALFDRIGMTGAVAETDWRGGYMLSSQMWTTARDLARFGQLYVDDGIVDGVRILPEGWRDYVSRPSGPQPSTGDFGYGATFWLLNRSPGMPADTIAAVGNRGQYVVIVPSRRIVIVRRAEDPAGARFDIAGFARDVLATVE